MKIERIDHIHIKPENFEASRDAFEKFFGNEFLLKMEMEEYGTEVAYEPFPIGAELFRPTDTSKSISAQRAEKAKGIFTVCYKVDNIKEAQAKLEEMGCPVLEWYDNGPIQEALFDTEAIFGISIELIEYPFESMRAMMGAG